MEIQELKAQVDELKERLRSIQTMTATLAIELNGSGPFEMPLLTQLSWLVPNEKDGVMGGFRSEDGKRIHACISYRAAAQLLNDHRAAPLQKQTLLPATSIDIGKPADAYVLPALPRFEGHLQHGGNIRILVFSSEDGRKILFPLSFDTYEQLLVQSKAALVSYQEEKWLDEIIPRHRPKSHVLAGG